MNGVRPLEILHVTDGLGPGGAERALLWHLSRMPKTRYRHHLAWLLEDHRMEEDFRPHVATLLPLHMKTRSDFPRVIFELARWIREKQPDVIFGQLLRAMAVARIAARIAGQDRLLMAWHNTSYDESALKDDFGGSRWKRGVARWFERGATLVDRHYIAVSEHVARHYAEHLWVPLDKVTVIHNPLDPERSRPVGQAALEALRAELGLAPGSRVLLSVARLVVQKAHADMLDAFPAVLRRFPESVLLVAGTGPLKPELEEKARRLEVADRVRFLGFRTDVPALLQLSDVFLFPSVYEGFGVALAEALANGVPSVASALPVHREVAGDLETVRYVPVHDPTALGRAIVELLEGGERMKAEARRVAGAVAARFSPEAQAMRFAETIERVARGE